MQRGIVVADWFLIPTISVLHYGVRHPAELTIDETDGPSIRCCGRCGGVRGEGILGRVHEMIILQTVMDRGMEWYIRFKRELAKAFQPFY